MRTRYLFILLAFTFAVSACEKTFLEKPITSATTIDSVFSNTTNALNAVAEAYHTCLEQGITYYTYGSYWNASIPENLSGSLNYGFSWTVANSQVMNGMTATGVIEDLDGFNYNYAAIRQAFLVKENIDQVPGMSASDKASIKAEMQMLAAYRLEQMMIIFGGVPIVTKTFNANDDLAVKRSSVQEVLDSVVSWCDQSAAVLPSKWSSTYSGRMTKAAALAIKSKAQLYAARPLFNTGTPYLDFGSNNNLICLGSADPGRWTTAAASAEAVISEAETNGGAHIINTGNPLADYGTATSTPGNAEVLLAFKYDYGGSSSVGSAGWGIGSFYDFHNWPAYGNMLTYNFATNYYKADGTDQTWPDLNVVTPFSDYLTKTSEMEARFKADYKPWQTDAPNNPGDSYWSNASTWQWGSPWVAIPTKFFYKASTRGWFEFPIFRLAAAYLSAAEAYNELGQPTQALARLNTIHTRAGLPAVTETDQTKLRAIIQREWAVEFFDENYRLHDVKHWKLADIGNGIIGGPIYGFSFNNGSTPTQYNNTNYQRSLSYTAFWAPKEYLCPIPQTEVNKGIIIQNPGY
ncbi:MAG: RagB/SusD family nutrient uptake outer membrane protein [Ilumatobacteraceae bacterium]